tara:strand:- start:312 stop:533 length:222 start_codon:yes stop_codon:yes gene_type:complete
MISMTKKIKRIIVTRTIVYDRDVFEQLPGINDDEQFVQWVNETADDDFKYPSNFTQDFSIHKNNEHSLGCISR